MYITVILLAGQGRRTRAATESADSEEESSSHESKKGGDTVTEDEEDMEDLEAQVTATMGNTGNQILLN